MNSHLSIHRVSMFVLFAVAAALFASDARAQYSYYPLTPCRVADTRGAAGTDGGPALGQGETRNFTVKGRCSVPTTAKAVTLNLTITGATAGGFLTIWPAGQARPNVSAIDFNAGDTLANGAIVGLAASTPDLAVYNNTGSVHVIIDITGYFQ